MDLKTKNKLFGIEKKTAPYLNYSLDFFQIQNFTEKSPLFSKNLTQKEP